MEAGHERTSPLLLGIDCGLSATKAVIFDVEGTELGASRVEAIRNSPRPGWAERDAERAWHDVTLAVRNALTQVGVSGRQIAAVGVAGYGDGICLVDRNGIPIRPVILSLDARASNILEGWKRQGIIERALALTGRASVTGSPAPLLRWLATNEPEALERTRWLLYAKDWIKLKLTGEVTTDTTEANSLCGNLHGEYSSEALSVYGLEQIWDKLPVVVPSAENVGRVTPGAAEAAGLTPGIPVASGLIDAVACIVGAGCTNPGQLCAVLGTWAINGGVVEQPVPSPKWLLRGFAEAGQWVAMSNSPASAANLEWFVRGFYPKARAYELMERELESVLRDDSRLLFYPFLYGSPYGSCPSASFLGLRGWHTRAHMGRAVLEGVVFNHLTHIDRLRTAYDFSDFHLTGGGSRSRVWGQMFADALDAPVSVSTVRESGAWGAAICAAVASGIYNSVAEVAERSLKGSRTYAPDTARTRYLMEARNRYKLALDKLMPVWEIVNDGE